MNSFDSRASTWDEDPVRVERARIASEEIRNRIPLTSDMTGFEYGCGTGLLSFFLQPYIGSITLGDSSEGMISVLKDKILTKDVKNMHPLKIDLLEDTIPGEKFDLTYSLLVLHHISDTDNIIKAFYEILKPSGFLCIADLDEEDGSFHGSDFTGHKGFNRDRLSGILKKHGFRDISCDIFYELKKKQADGQIKAFPMFLMIGRK